MNMHARDLHAEAADGRPHAVVIGAGFGGLAAAVRLGARGYRVTVLERLEQPGGRASVFRQDGFTFDAGPTIITAPFVYEELWALCGRRMSDDVPMKAMEPFYRIRFDDGTYFTCSSDHDAMREEVRRLSPGDVEGYERFMEESRVNYAVGFEKLGDLPFTSVGTMARWLPWMLKRRAHESVWRMVCRHVRHPQVRIALSFHPLFVGGNPTRVTSIYSLINHMEREYGVHYCWGGTGALVRGLVGLIEGQGGSVRCNAPVAQVTTHGRRVTGVRLEDGSVLPASVVVSNADAAWTYGTLLPQVRRRRWTDLRLRWLTQSMSVFVWYFGTRGTFDDVDHHTILMGPRYRGLLRDIFRRRVLADDMSLYLYRPTASDPSLAPEGCDAFYALSPVPNLNGSTDWHTMAEPYRQRIQQRLEDTVMPGLGARVVTSRVFTPLDFRDRLNAPDGAAFGPEPLLWQSAWFRPHNVSEEVEGLYLVGAGTHPGAGVPSVVTSAKVLDRVVPHASEVLAQ